MYIDTMAVRSRQPRAGRLLAAMLGLALVSGCAPSGAARGDAPPLAALDPATLFELEPVAGWQPPAWSPSTGVTLGEVPEPGAQSGDDTPDEAAPPGTGDTELGLVTARIRNDEIGLSARYVELPMAHPFNERMEALVQLAIDETSGTHSPQVYPVSAKLGARGCVPGSLGWSAERVLQDPATGPAGGVGTALTCEVFGAFGELLEVGVRVVTGRAPSGGATEILSHRVYRLYANVADGTLREQLDRWSSDASPDLWERTIAELRRASGGLSQAPISDPDDEQLALARAALDTARTLPNGDIVVTVGAGLAAPELTGLGAAARNEPIEVTVAAEIADGWLTDEMHEFQQQRTQPFVGLPAWNAQVPVNCALAACIAITFDDGPSAFTPELLDMLAAHRAGATFFMQGRSIEQHPDTVVRASSEGHELASHTMTHPRLPKLPLDEAASEVRDAATLITELTGAPVTSFRPPYGEVNDKIIDEVGLPAVLWSIDTNDWKEPGTRALIDRAVTPARPGDIVLFHDTHETTVRAADALLTGLADRGFTPVTLTQLFGGTLPEGKVRSR